MEIDKFLANLTGNLEAVWGLSFGASSTSAAVANDIAGEVCAAGNSNASLQQEQKFVPESEPALPIDGTAEPISATS